MIAHEAGQWYTIFPEISEMRGSRLRLKYPIYESLGTTQPLLNVQYNVDIENRSNGISVGLIFRLHLYPLVLGR